VDGIDVNALAGSGGVFAVTDESLSAEVDGSTLSRGATVGVMVFTDTVRLVIGFFSLGPWEGFAAAGALATLAAEVLSFCTDVVDP
jgi:hypothetical protein